MSRLRRWVCRFGAALGDHRRRTVSFSFIHSKDVPVSPFSRSFRGAPRGANPESRGLDYFWIPGSTAKGGRPGMTGLGGFPVSPWRENALRRGHIRGEALTIIDRLFSCELP